MKQILVFLLISITFVLGSCENNNFNADNWKLIWSQEFDDSVIDRNVWNFEIGNGHSKGIPGWGNNELEYYTDGENAYIQNGILVIEARKEGRRDAYGTYNYTSSRMTTQGKFEVKYGRIEVRAKFPYGKGLWPAVWMLGSDIGSVGWPNCGEIDIVEFLGHESTKVYGTVHGPGYSGGNSISGSYELTDPDFTEDFHTFGIIWDEEKIDFYVDDYVYYTVSKMYVLSRGYSWVFDKPFFIIVNLAVGGNWPGYPDENTQFPAKMYIDYIRVWQKEE
ncbi:MAG: hypothetical protein PWP54_1104 [Thermosipho sp. (in: thermotogales)]|nr:hypothetical protein [Thermosipho sp. (in: thermotogales)]